MASVNKAIILGRITQDLELKTTQSDKKVLSFGLATNRTWKDTNGEKQEKTDFHNIVAWGKPAEILSQYAVKGQELYVEGRLSTNTWEDADGKKNYKTEVILEQFQFGAKPQGAQDNQPAPAGPAPEDEVAPEDIPF